MGSQEDCVTITNHPKMTVSGNLPQNINTLEIFHDNLTLIELCASSHAQVRQEVNRN